jgi:hypothetical protein
MAIRDTVSVAKPRHRQRVRSFALIWTGITLLIGALTFIAIYAGTGVAASRGIAPASITVNNSANDTSPNNTGAQPPVEGQQPQVVAVVQVTATSVPATAAPKVAANQAATQNAAPAGSATIPPIKDTDFDLGIAVQENGDANTFKAWTAMAGEQLKLNWVKMQIVWHDIEKEKGKIDFGVLDMELPMLHNANIKVMLSIAKAPDWARDKGAKTKPDANGDLHDGPPANPKDLADFITAILKRYPGMVHAIEVWNEINLDREWTTQPQSLDPKRYVTLLQVAHDAIKAADPNIVVISASLSPVGASSDQRYIDDFAYFDMLIKADILKYADCVGAHHNGINVPPDADANKIPPRNVKFRGPWDNPNHSWAFKTTLEGYASRIKAAGSTLKLCVTEFGWPSTQDMDGKVRPGFEFAADNTLADQADFTDRAIGLMQTWGFVRLAFLWNLNYAAQGGFNLNGPVGDNVAWSILGKNFQPRPVWQKIVDRNFRGQVRKASQ